MSPIDKAIETAGGLSALAEKLMVRPNRLNNWRSRGVPVGQCVAIERATEGEVTRKDLRPDDWDKIWPELTQSGRRSTDPKPKESTEQ